MCYFIDMTGKLFQFLNLYWQRFLLPLTVVTSNRLLGFFCVEGKLEAAHGLRRQLLAKCYVPDVITQSPS